MSSVSEETYIERIEQLENDISTLTDNYDAAKNQVAILKSVNSVLREELKEFEELKRSIETIKKYFNGVV